MAGQAVLGETVLEHAKAIAAGEPAEAIDVLIGQYSSLVFRIAYSILRNHHDAEDAAQECFLKLVKARRKLAQMHCPKTWLARVAWTTALDRRAGRGVFRGTQLPESEEMLAQLPDGRETAELELASRQMQQVLERLIAGLPEELRLPLELSTVEELNSVEIAGIMDIPEGSVRTRLLRARRLLKEKLAALLEVKKHG
jgi:RNA polymerase sigma-70 factor, ECF subfamily